MTHRIAVLSPHLDDAIFDCCDHLIKWRSRGSELLVYTVFCNFQTSHIPAFQQEVMRRAGITSLDEFEATRRREDVQAMEKLSAKWQHWDFTDAGFRACNGSPQFPDQAALCSGKLHSHDAHLLSELTETIAARVNADCVLVPFGVGQHQDHLLVRRAAEAAQGIGELRYYLDFPYARNPRRWRYQQLIEALRARKSVLWMSSQKRALMSCYASQMPQVFRWPAFFPEVILS